MKVPGIVGGDPGSLLHYMPMHQALELINKAQEGTAPRQIEPPETPPETE
jgi:hypothetical protein